MESSITRRRLLGAAAAAGTIAIGARGGAGAQEATPSPAVGGEWTFTDDKGVTVTLPSRPVRIVADVNAAAPLWDFGIRPLAVFGWNATESGEFGDAGGRVDSEQVEVIGTPPDLINVEDAAALGTELIVTITWTPDDPLEYWSIAPEVIPQLTTFAPIVAISATGSADENLARFAELAASLGADLDSPAQAAERDRYEAALARFPEVAQEKSDLEVLFAYISDAEPVYYVANAPDWADLTLYQSLGLSIVKPETGPGTFWQSLSMEEALQYPADVLFHSTRPGTLTAEELAADPIFGQHPAIKAGQIGAWNQDFILSYRGMADALEATIAPIETATKVI